MKAKETASVLLVSERDEDFATFDGIFAASTIKLVKTKTPDEAIAVLNERKFAVAFISWTSNAFSAPSSRLGAPVSDPAEILPLIVVTDLGISVDEVTACDIPGVLDVMARPLVPSLVQAKAKFHVELHRRNERARLSAEQAAKESEDRFQVMADCAPVLLWMSGTDALCNFFNQPWLDFTGRTLEEEYGYGWAEGIYPEDFQHCVDTYMRAFSRREPFTMDYRLRRADGEYRWVLDRAAPRFTEGGAFAGYVGSCIDITDRITVEQERERLLRAETAARTEAERLSRLKDEFLATVSHELRTPMNAITGWAELLEAGGLDDAAYEEAVTSICRNARVQNQLIGDILDMSRIITGKLKLDMQPIDMALIIRDAIESIRLAADAKKIKVRIVSDPTVGLVLGDAMRLQQIVWNLLSNAVKFTPTDGEIRIDLKRVNGRVELRVADNGEGIHPDFLPHVFDRFRQAYGAINRRHGGLGLGLSIVKHLTELHGGTVSVASDGEKKGATFTVIVPLAAAKLAKPRGSIMRHAPEPQKQPLAGTEILVVDDQTDVLKLVSFILTRSGAAVTTACSVTEALTAFAAHRPDLILSDIGMPGETGIDLIQSIRSLGADEGGGTPAIALSAHVSDKDRAEALAAGFHEHMTKPVDKQTLLVTIARLTGRDGDSFDQRV